MTHDSDLPSAATRALLDAYFAGEATPAEAARAQAYLAEHPVEMALRRSVQRALDVPPRSPAANVDEAVRALRARLASNAAQAAHAARMPRDMARGTSPWARRPIVGDASVGRLARWVAVGAAAALGVMLVLTRRSSVPSMPGASRVYHTTFGQRAAITLADGSHVTLAPASRLEVPGDFGPRHRTVALVGEAYFDVATVRTVPFVVRTASFETRVLGTAFDLRRYADDRETRVAVVSGKVAVGRADSDGQPAVVTAGHIARATDSTTTVSTADVAPYAQWPRGALTFNDVPIPVALATIGHWYGFHFRLQDTSLVHQRFSASFEQWSAEDVLSSLQLALNVTTTFDGDSAGVRIVILSPRRGVKHAPAARRLVPQTLIPTREVGR